MRFAKKKPYIGQKRVVSRFLFLPKELPIGSRIGTVETRWLERATWMQEYTIFHTSSGIDFDTWHDVYWIEDKYL